MSRSTSDYDHLSRDQRGIWIWRRVDPITGRRAKRSTGQRSRARAGLLAHPWEVEFDRRGEEARAKMLRSRRPSTWIYAIRNERTGSVKIGIASSVQSRLSSLQTACEDELRLLACAPGGRADEASAHELLHEFRIRGEWFVATAPVLGFVAQMQAQGAP